MKYRLILTDFDHTMLREDGTVSDATVAAIADFRARGGHFVVCTGRMSCSIDKTWQRRLGIEDEYIPVVGFQGSYITDRDGNVLYADGLDPEVVARIVDKAGELNMHVHTYDPNHVYVGEMDEITHEYRRLTGADERVVGDLKAFVLSHRDLIYPKTMVVIPAERVEEVKAAFAKVDLEGVEYYMSSPTYLEFMNKTSGKGNALLRVAELYGIPVEETIGVGDNQNDVSLVRAAGLGVAVGNALEVVKEAADYVSVTNDEDPIVDIINKFCGR